MSGKRTKMPYAEFLQLPVEISDTIEFRDHSDPPPETSTQETTIGRYYGRTAADLFRYYGHRQPVRVVISTRTNLQRGGQPTSTATMHFADGTIADLRADEIKRLRRRLGQRREG